MDAFFEVLKDVAIPVFVASAIGSIVVNRLARRAARSGDTARDSGTMRWVLNLQSYIANSELPSRDRIHPAPASKHP